MAFKPNSSIASFCTIYILRMVLIVEKNQKKNDIFLVKIVWNSNISVHINKVVLEDSHIPVCLYTVYGCFFTTIEELSSYDRGHVVPKAKNIYSL